MPNFELLDALTLNKIIQNAQFIWKEVWRSKKNKKSTVSFTEDRLLV